MVKMAIKFVEKASAKIKLNNNLASMIRTLMIADADLQDEDETVGWHVIPVSD